jgi:phage terminase large subunit-like protein
MPFSQGPDRLEADKNLLDMILAKRITHDGNPALRRHIDNADRKPDSESRKLRIVKREQALKIDLTVCLSMALLTAQKLGL